MNNQPKMFELVWNPTRWTLGVAWDYYDTRDYEPDLVGGHWQLEISIQVPLVALSILIKGDEN